MPANSSPDAGFTPRKEFIRDQRAPPNSFSLLAIASSNFIRLYSFPLPVIAALRRLFEQRSIIATFREDANQNLCEFSLQGKPWASPKSITTEKLLVDVLAIIYQHGYTFLSAIDYGREHDDRLAMAFSKPSSSPRPATPRPSSQIPDGSGSSFSDKAFNKRIPFALSFPSATMLRVIAPPLHSTPAILQAVRGSWPRGVVSEKRIGDPYGSFEFKLKGYRWFQEDTFATDSLHHILSLLSSLDAHSFSLLTSISLTNRSRVKDLWIFTGPAATSTEDLLLPDSPVPSILNSSLGQIKRADPPIYNQSPTHQGSQSQHRRVATAPAASPTAPLLQHSSHTRSASDNSAPRHLVLTPHTNQSTAIQGVPSSPPSPQSPSHHPRKPAPRAQVPISVIHEAEQEGQRTNLPSTISSGVENMTGVGATGYSPDVFYTTSPFGAVDPSGRSPPPLSPVPISAAATRPRSATPPSRGRSPLRPVSSRAKTPPLLTSNSPPSSPSHAPPSPPGRADVFPTHHIQGTSEPSGAGGTPPLLGPGVFRDSAFSSTTTASCEVPIKWTGRDTQYGSHPEQGGHTRSNKPSFEERISPGPMLPGGWQSTPVEEKIEEAGDGTLEGLTLEQDKSPERPLQEVGSRVESPELMPPDERLRKSEAGLVELITATLPPPPVPLVNKGKDKDAPNPGSGQGWVLVNVEGRKSPSLSEVPASPVIKDNRKVDSAKPGGPKPPAGQQASISPAAKAIVIIDAMENDGKSKSGLGNDGGGEGTPSRVRKFFTLARKNSKKVQEQGADEDGAKNKTKVKTQSGFREKIKRIGTAEAARNDDKRRSFD